MTIRTATVEAAPQGEGQEISLDPATRMAKLLAKDPQVAAAAADPGITKAKMEPNLSLAQLVALCLEGYRDRPALAARAVEIVVDPVTKRRRRALLSHFETVSYGELEQRIRRLIGYWSRTPGRELGAEDFIGLLAFTGVDYVAVDLAATCIGSVTVPMPTNASLAQLQGMVAEFEPLWLAVSVEQLGVAVELASASQRLKGILVFDYRPEVEDEREAFEAAGKRLTEAGMGDLLVALADAISAVAPVPLVPTHTAPGADDRLSTIYYTSGSTGAPKGAMHSERTVKAIWRMTAPVPQLVVHYLPLNHSAGRTAVAFAIGSGGTIFFTAKSDLSTLFDDMRFVRPTLLRLVPRICEMLYQLYQVELSRRTAGAKDLEALKDELILEIRNGVLGGRVIDCSVGAAPMAPELKAFTDRCFGYPIDISFGSTEAMALMHNGRLMKPPVIDFKLDDVPELGYFRTDKPYPRGEFLVKTRTITLGYYKRPETTATVMDPDGYYRTGDIMALIGPDEFAYVDRRNNVLKLAQGEFVAISQLEALFTNGHRAIRQAYLYGSSERSYLVGVIVPNREALAEMSVNPTDDAAVKTALREAIREIARVGQLNAYEVPRDFIIEWEPFTLENGLLAGMGKYQRPRLKERYGTRLDGMYAEMAAAQAEDLRRLSVEGRSAPVIETVGRAVRSTLGLETLDLSARISFAELGGDSLSALSCSLLLEEIYGVEVPVGVINNPAGSLQQLAGFIERALAGAAPRPTFASVHGRGATEVRAADLTLDRFLDAQDLQAGYEAAAPSAEVRTVLLTGANGFLGRFLCLDWLERVASTGGKVICIARGADNEEAYQRVAGVFDGVDPELKERFRKLAANHLQVLAGDLGDASLGLSRRDWEALAETVDIIVHPAAHVNHLLPYSQLFAANVVGTAELIRLAIHQRLKPFINVSTAAISMYGGAGKGIDEDADLRTTVPTWSVGKERYAEGYVTSKWAGEILLRDAADRFRLPVSVFRSGMILAHSRYRGQINVPDTFTRWLLSTVLTGLAPRSFFGDGRARAHYSGLPGDFIAAAIVGIGLANRSGYHTYHVVNPHDDGVSMDTFVNWMIDKGISIQKIDDYQEWYRRFETALRGLPEAQRQNSSLPVIHQYEVQSANGAEIASSAVRFREAVRKLKIGPEQDIPHLTAEFLYKCLDDLRSLSLI